jgi:hypothetical protein
LVSLAAINTSSSERKRITHGDSQFSESCGVLGDS